MQNIQGAEDCYEIDLSSTAYCSLENVAIFHFNLSQGLNDVFLDGSNFQREICIKKCTFSASLLLPCSEINVYI